MKRDRPYIIVLTGPESTGKTTLAGQLAGYFGGRWVPEYARNYVEHLDRPYDFEDVVRIARYQIKQTDRMTGGDVPVVFFDTDLIILKIWFQVRYKNVPGWLQEAIEKRKIDLYLLCRPDIPWKYDPVRENPGQKREELFFIYEKELHKLGFPYRIVEGEGEVRLRNAKLFVEEVIKNDK